MKKRMPITVLGIIFGIIFLGGSMEGKKINPSFVSKEISNINRQILEINQDLLDKESWKSPLGTFGYLQAKKDVLYRIGASEERHFRAFERREKKLIEERTTLFDQKKMLERIMQNL